MSIKKMRVLTLLARHGVAKYTGAVNDLQTLIRSTLPDVAHELLIADNSLPLGHESWEAGVKVIGAANEAWEFSAWDSAVAHLGDELDRFDFIHLATSAFKQLYVNYLNRFDTKMLRLASTRAAAVGHVDYYGEPESLLNMGCQAWLRTSYVFLPPTEVRLLGSFVSARASDGHLFFSEDPIAPFLNDAPISHGYRRNIVGWLTGEGTGQGTEWHSRFNLSQETLPFFRQKVLAIFNEQMLSNRLRAQGCAIVDATWLSTESRARGDASQAVYFPAWPVQVSSRDVDAAPAHLRVPG